MHTGKTDASVKHTRLSGPRLPLPSQRGAFTSTLARVEKASTTNTTKNVEVTTAEGSRFLSSVCPPAEHNQEEMKTKRRRAGGGGARRHQTTWDKVNLDATCSVAPHTRALCCALFLHDVCLSVCVRVWKSNP